VTFLTRGSPSAASGVRRPRTHLRGSARCPVDHLGLGGAFMTLQNRLELINNDETSRILVPRNTRWTGCAGQKTSLREARGGAFGPETFRRIIG
jgi:hypothetical protein